jgi:hypothetical protein
MLSVAETAVGKVLMDDRELPLAAGLLRADFFETQYLMECLICHKATKNRARVESRYGGVRRHDSGCRTVRCVR